MRRLLVTLIVVSLVLAVGARAQSTGTPVFLSPHRLFTTYEVGGSFSDPGFGGWALEGFYRHGFKKFDIGIRAGLADSDNTETTFLIGGDFRMPLVANSKSFPLDGALILGLGGNLGDPGDVGYVPIGFSLGRRLLLENSQTSFVPYVEPVMTPTFGDQSDLLWTLGLGVDMQFSTHFGVKVSGAFGDLDGISISASYLH